MGDNKRLSGRSNALIHFVWHLLTAVNKEKILYVYWPPVFVHFISKFMIARQKGLPYFFMLISNAVHLIKLLYSN